MPHCKKAKKKKIVQNEDEVDNSDDEPEDKIKGQALTCSQSSDARMATKLRSVVERVFCNLKKILNTLKLSKRNLDNRARCVSNSHRRALHIV